MKACCRDLDAVALEAAEFSNRLPEVFALRSVYENNDAHQDDVFQQSLRLFRWVEVLPVSLPLANGTASRLQRVLQQTLDYDHGHHTIKDILRFTALVHDTGKMETLTQREDGTTCCPKHEAAGARLCPLICSRFDFTPVETRIITTLVARHGDIYMLFKAFSAHPTSNAHEEFHHVEKEMGEHLLALLLLAYGDMATSHLEMSHPVKYRAALDFYTRWIQRALSGQALVRAQTEEAENGRTG